jgi:hypothetical protein
MVHMDYRWPPIIALHPTPYPAGFARTAIALERLIADGGPLIAIQKLATSNPFVMS